MKTLIFLLFITLKVSGQFSFPDPMVTGNYKGGKIEVIVPAVTLLSTFAVNEYLITSSNYHNMSIKAHTRMTASVYFTGAIITGTSFFILKSPKTKRFFKKIKRKFKR